MSRSCLVIAASLFATAASAVPACFTPAEIEAADLRVLQQQFNVAALNCQTDDPNGPGFAERYNQFIQHFAKPLQDNAERLQRHFGKDRNDLDRWMTRVANQAGQSVMNQPDFCQVAWDRLERMVALDTAAMEKAAVDSGAAISLAPACPEQKSAKKKPPSK